jgi:hypothetical protein
MTKINAKVENGCLIVSQAELDALGLVAGDEVTVEVVKPAPTADDPAPQAAHTLWDLAGMLKLPPDHPGLKGDVEAFVRAGIDEALAQKWGRKLNLSADGT